MEAVANYNEILPGVVLKTFVKDYFKNNLKIETTIRSILSRNKALQAIRTFSAKSINLSNENNIQERVVEAVVPQVEQQVMETDNLDQASPILSTPTVEENPSVLPSIVGARVVKTDLKVFNLLKTGENLVDRPFSMENNLEVPETSIDETSTNLENQPSLEPVSDMQPTATLEPIPVSEPLPEMELPVLEEKTPVVDTNIDVALSEEKVESVPTSEYNEPEQPEVTYLEPMEIPSNVEDRLVNLETPAIPTVDNTESQDHVGALESLKTIVSENTELRENNTILSERAKDLEEQVSLKDSSLEQVKEELNAANSQIIEFGEAAKKLKLENDTLKQELEQAKLQLNKMTEAINSAISGYQKSA